MAPPFGSLLFAAREKKQRDPPTAQRLRESPGAETPSCYGRPGNACHSFCSREVWARRLRAAVQWLPCHVRRRVRTGSTAVGSRSPPFKAMQFRSAPSLDIEEGSPLPQRPVQRALQDVEQRASRQALGMQRSGDGGVSSSSGGGSRDAVPRPTQAATRRGSPPPPGLRGARPPAPPHSAPPSTWSHPPGPVVQRGLGMRREDRRGLGRRREEWSDVRLPALHPAACPPWRGPIHRGVAQV